MNEDDRKKLRDSIAEFFKTKAVKAALVWLSQKIAWLTTGAGGWFGNLVLSYLWDAIGDKAVRWALRKGALAVDLQKGRIKIVKINKAKQDDDVKTYIDVISDI